MTIAFTSAGKQARLNLTSDQGINVEQVSVVNRFARLTRPEINSGSRANNQCTEFGINDYAEGIQHHGQLSLVPNDLAWWDYESPRFGEKIAFTFARHACRHADIFSVLDGLGGVVEIALTIEILEARTEGGAVEWFQMVPILTVMGSSISWMPSADAMSGWILIRMDYYSCNHLFSCWLC